MARILTQLFSRMSAILLRSVKRESPHYTERMNQHLEIVVHQRDWDHYLHFLLITVCSFVHKLTCEIIAIIIMGHEICLPSDLKFQFLHMRLKIGRNMHDIHKIVCRNIKVPVTERSIRQIRVAAQPSVLTRLISEISIILGGYIQDHGANKLATWYKAQGDLFKSFSGLCRKPLRSRSRSIW